MGILMAIIVYLVIFATPFLIGWNIIKKKRPRDVGDLVAAIVLLLFYFPTSSFLMVTINEDLPPYAVTNEGFMFHAEKTYGIENFYNLAQKNLQAYQKKAGYVNERPQWRYFGVHQFTDEQSILFYFYRFRDDRLPLSVEIKLPEKEHFSNVQERNEAKSEGLSFWNENMRTGINEDHWNRNFKMSLGAAKESFAALLYLFCSICWIFPLAATAYKAHSKWLFYSLWVVVLALYIMNIHTWSQQTPALQYERCNAQTALAEISKAENQTTLSKLLQHPTAVLENDKSKTIIDAPMLCGGKFFTAKFLCWDLGKSTYLYYSPTDLVESQLLTKYAKIHRPKENFYLVSYPDFTRRSNNIWWQFVIIQTLAGSLWVAMFIFALKKRRQDKNPQEETSE